MTWFPMSTLATKAAQAARDIITELGIRDPADLNIELIAAHHDLFVKYRALPGQEGHLLRGKRAGLVVVDTEALATWKWRFVIAHELGHFLLHEGADQFHLCTSVDAYRWYRLSGIEAQANAFASELLLPTALFAPRCNIEESVDLHTISELARRFRTSLTATALGYIRHTSAPCALVHSRAGQIDWCVKTRGFLPKIKSHGVLKEDTFAAACHRGEDVPHEPLPISAREWSGTIKASHLTLLEHSFYIESYGAVLTWLWHEPQQEREDARMCGIPASVFLENLARR